MCFSLAWLQQMFILVIVVLAILALLKLLISALTSGAVPFWPLASWPPNAGSPGGFLGFIVAAMNIMIWAFIAIVAVYFIFMLIGCLLSFSGGFPGLLPHR